MQPGWKIWVQDFALADNRRDVAMAILTKFKTLGCSDTRLDSFMLDRTYAKYQISAMAI